MSIKSPAHNALLASLLGPRINGKSLISPEIINQISNEISRLELQNAQMSLQIEKCQNDKRDNGHSFGLD
ncbi:MAG: hypothetical protein AAFR39_06675 [Pseudomonadota bacterium]